VSVEPSDAQLAALRAGDPTERIALVRILAAKDPADHARWLAALDASVAAAGGRRAFRGVVDRVLLGGDIEADELVIDEFPSRELAAESLRNANPHAEAALAGAFVLAAKPRRVPGLALRAAGLWARLRGGRAAVAPDPQALAARNPAVDPAPDALLGFLASDAERPLCMLNLNRHSDAAEYARYGRNTLPHLLRRGARPIWAGDALPAVVGSAAHPLQEAWDEILLVSYPSRRAMLEMVSDPGYQAGLPHREAGLARAALIATCPSPARRLRGDSGHLGDESARRPASGPAREAP